MFGRLFQRRSPTPQRQPATAPGERVYAIGDIHGRADLLARMHEQIRADTAVRQQVRVNRIVYLGDYVDRGHQSRDVVEMLAAGPPAGFEAVCLKGNHEDAFVQFLEDPAIGPSWFAFGGSATALSYGVALPPEGGEPERFEAVRQALCQRVPQHHTDFLQRLPLSYRSGDYLFVHAGIRPGVPLDEQSPDDLMWIRDEFLRRRDDHGVIVVHGHSISGQPEVRNNRIGIDTGAYATNVLTCLVVEGASQRFIRTG